MGRTGPKSKRRQAAIDREKSRRARERELPPAQAENEDTPMHDDEVIYTINLSISVSCPEILPPLSLSRSLLPIP